MIPRPASRPHRSEQIAALFAVAFDQVGVGIEQVALHREAVPLAVEVHAEPRLHAAEIIVGVARRTAGKAVAVEIIGIDPRRATVADRHAVP